MIYDDFSERTQKVLRYCTTCPKMCRFSCPVAHEEARETVTPWGLVSLLHAGTTDGPVELDAALAGLLMHCTGCLRCHSACLHGNHVPRALFEGRAAARERGLALGYEPSRSGDATPGLELDGPALGFAATSPLGYFPSCAHRQPDSVALRRVAATFARLGLEVALAASPFDCCGYPLLAGGMAGQYRDRAAQLGRALSGFERIVTDCDQFLSLSRTPVWRDELVDGGLPQVVHWSEHLAEVIAEGGQAPQRPLSTPGLVYHDGCRLGRGAGVYDAPRALLAWASGGQVPGELPDAREMAYCCGAGAGYETVEPERAREIAATLLAALPEDGWLVSSRPACVAWLEASAPRRVRALFDVIAEAMGVE